jgi:hypothetical protein
MIVVGGVIPPQDFDELRAAGAAAIFGPGTVIPDAAYDLLIDWPPAARPPVPPVPPLPPVPPVGDPPDVARYADAVLAGSRAAIARAITLVESSRPDHRVLAQHVLTRLLPHAGPGPAGRHHRRPRRRQVHLHRRLGGQLIDQGHRVAVLAVDPSSSRSGGSILGDKTRMTRLATDPNAFVRPSPTAGTLGGVARATRESLVVMAAAGYDILLVETVGVGQSETARGRDDRHLPAARPGPHRRSAAGHQERRP